MKILGISGLYHDSAAALVIDGEIIAAAQEERFTRKKHDPGFPKSAIEYCMKEAGIGFGDLDYIAFYDNPLLTLDRYMKNVLSLGKDCEDLINSGFEPLFSKRIWIHRLIQNETAAEDGSIRAKFLTVKHHISHAASAYFPSPYMESIIITLDGVGEWTTLSIGVGKNNSIELKEEIRYPHSLGLFYSAFTYFCGFKVNSGDYKFMGLAPYGVPRYYDKILENIIHIKDDGSFSLNLSYFDYQNGRTMINEEKMAALFDGGRREPESVITQREMDIAASVQLVTEEVIKKIAIHAKQEYGKNIDSLVLAGGVALNCVSNGKLMKERIFEHIWIQPAAGDAGGALGAALYVYYDMLNNERKADGIVDTQKGSYLGPKFKSNEIIEFCEKNNYVYHKEEYTEKEIARHLSDGKVIGIFGGRMEFGPRALGNRSIIADPRSESMQSKMNLKIKYRESFRPFAPAVLLEDASSYFELDKASPYMLLCANVVQNRRNKFDLQKSLKKSDGDMLPVVNMRRSDIPAVTHVDYSARIQTVTSDNKRFYNIINEFKKLTGCPVVINTSFNVRGEPIVCTPEDAYKCFMRTEMDVLVLEDIILFKQEQPQFHDNKDWRKEYVLD